MAESTQPNEPPKSPDTPPQEGLGAVISKMAKIFGVTVPSSDIETLINLATPLVKQTLAPPPPPAKSIEEKTKVLDDGECLTDEGVLELITRVKKGVIERGDAITTLKVELKRQYRQQALHQAEIADIWKKIEEEKTNLRKAVDHTNEYRTSPPVNDDSRFDQYVSDLRLIATLKKSIQEKELRVYKEEARYETPPSIPKLEEALIDLLH